MRCNVWLALKPSAYQPGDQRLAHAAIDFAAYAAVALRGAVHLGVRCKNRACVR